MKSKPAIAGLASTVRPRYSPSCHRAMKRVASNVVVQKRLPFSTAMDTAVMLAILNKARPKQAARA